MEIAEVNKKIVQRFYELVEQENYAEAKKLCHKDFVFYFQMDTPIYGADGFVESERKNFSAFGHFTMINPSLSVSNINSEKRIFFPEGETPIKGALLC